MVLTFDYDASYSPSASVIDIGVGPSDGTPARLTVRAMIDTGSDASMFPLHLLLCAGGPAPLALVTLKHHVNETTWTGVPMLLDTGADVSLIPQAAVNQLGLTILSDTPYEVSGFDGSISQTFAIELRLIFWRRTFRGKFLLADQTFGIIGRDILNLVPLLFDGPRLEWSEYRSPR